VDFVAGFGNQRTDDEQLLTKADIFMHAHLCPVRTVQIATNLQWAIPFGNVHLYR